MNLDITTGKASVGLVPEFYANAAGRRLQPEGNGIAGKLASVVQFSLNERRPEILFHDGISQDLQLLLIPAGIFCAASQLQGGEIFKGCIPGMTVLAVIDYPEVMGERK